MNTKNKIKEIDVEKELELDPLSDRYRICRNPECRRPHMVANKSRDYCCDQCADNHYNYLRKYIALQKANSKTPTNSTIINSESEWMRLGQSNIIYDKGKNIEKNIEFLRSLNIDSISGTKYSLDFFFYNNFDFNGFSSRDILHNIDEKYGVKYLIIGDFYLFLIDPQNLLIFYNKPKI